MVSTIRGPSFVYDPADLARTNTSVSPAITQSLTTPSCSRTSSLSLTLSEWRAGRSVIPRSVYPGSVYPGSVYPRASWAFCPMFYPCPRSCSSVLALIYLYSSLDLPTACSDLQLPFAFFHRSFTPAYLNSSLTPSARRTRTSSTARPRTSTKSARTTRPPSVRLGALICSSAGSERMGTSLSTR